MHRLLTTLLIVFLKVSISHQSFFRINENKNNRNFFALKQPPMLPGPFPQPQPIFLPNGSQSASHPLPQPANLPTNTNHGHPLPPGAPIPQGPVPNSIQMARFQPTPPQGAVPFHPKKGPIQNPMSPHSMQNLPPGFQLGGPEPGTVPQGVADGSMAQRIFQKGIPHPANQGPFQHPPNQGPHPFNGITPQSNSREPQPNYLNQRYISNQQHPGSLRHPNAHGIAGPMGVPQHPNSQGGIPNHPVPQPVQIGPQYQNPQNTNPGPILHPGGPQRPNVPAMVPQPNGSQIPIPQGGVLHQGFSPNQNPFVIPHSPMAGPQFNFGAMPPGAIPHPMMPGMVPHPMMPGMVPHPSMQNPNVQQVVLGSHQNVIPQVLSHPSSAPKTTPLMNSQPNPKPNSPNNQVLPTAFPQTATKPNKIGSFQPLLVSSQPDPTTVNDILEVPSVVVPETIASTEAMTNPQSVEENSTEPWKPIVLNKVDNAQVQFVMSNVNASSSEESEILPLSQPLVGPPRRNYMGPRAPARENTNKLESIKRGLYGILFGRKGPPTYTERHHSPPPVHPEPYSDPLYHGTQWQPVDNNLQSMASKTVNNVQQNSRRITCKIFTNDVCLEVNDYPFEAIMEDLMRDTRYVNDMYADVPDQGRFELMEGITEKDEEKYNYQHYYGNKNSHSHRDYGQEGGNVCPSEVVYSQPRKGRKINGDWKFIVNVPQFPQTTRLERCLKPVSKCSYVGPQVDSQCSQLYTLQRLLVWDPQRRLHIELLTIPSACSCYLIPFYKQPNQNQSMATAETTQEVSIAWPDDTALDEFSSDEILKDENPNRKSTRNPSLFGPYSRTLKKYFRQEFLEKESNSKRPHTNFGRPLVAEKSYVDQTNHESSGKKINFSHHPTLDYLKPWN